MNSVIHATALVQFLRNMGAGDLPHARGRTLYEHLVSTQSILRHWSQPEWLCAAGGIHSIYGTDVYKRRLITTERREQVQAAVGIPAERLAYLFCTVSRKDLFARIDRGEVEIARSLEQLSDQDCAYLLLLHMANTAEQSCSADGAPGSHLANLSRVGHFVRSFLTEIPPVFDRCQTIVRSEHEQAGRDAYCTGIAAMARERHCAIELMTKASSDCPWVAEPAVWLAYLSLQQGEPGTAAAWIAHAGKTLALWGTAWDKRLPYEAWSSFIAFISDQAAQENTVPLPAPDPHNLPRFVERISRGDTDRTVGVLAEPVHDAGPEKTVPRRFQNYVASFSTSKGGREMKIYPGLRAQAWHSPSDFPLASALEAEYPAIRQELSSLENNLFTRESESIPRSGSWDVLFFHERGRRNEAVCARCPVTSTIIEAHGTVRTLAGLCYISRLRAGTHIAPHRGPTNVRLRCHLGIQVPKENCGIRVDGQTRRWEEGRCLVFDDFLTHEAWNHSAVDRIVLIADLWHPKLTAEEISLLTGLHRYAANEAVSLTQYWAANEKARSQMD